MTVKTFGVKVSEETYDKVKEMIEASGITAKDWFEKAVSLSEINQIKQGATDYSQDLSELEVHTSRIYELVSNMIQRSIYIKDSEVKKVTDKLEQTEAVIGEYQEKSKKANEELLINKQSLLEYEEEKKDLLKQLDELRSINSNNQLLIEQSKEKIDTLSGLVTKYQSFAEENEQLKTNFEKESERFKSQISELTTQSRYDQEEVKDLKAQKDLMIKSHSDELDRLSEKKDYEKDKAILELERSYQEKLLKANDNYNEKIRALYDEISAIRKEYDVKIERLSKANENKSDK